MKRTYKYRIYPSVLQRKTLQDIFWFCRFLYNSALEERISFYKKSGKSKSYFEQCKALPNIKEYFLSETENIHSQVLQQTLKQLDKAYSNFFRRIKEKASEAGFPRFKSADRFRSICFPQPSPDLSGGCVKKLPNNKLRVSGLGDIKVKWHRELPKEARCKQVRIIKQADQYYICLICDNVQAQPLASTGKTVAIDMGIANFITTDDGTSFHHPKPYKTSKEKLAYLNQRLAAKQRGSNNRRRTIISSQKAHQKVHNIRMDFQHKVAKQLVSQNDIIIMEKLNIKSMLEAKGFEVSKSNISDASWGNFAALLIYKAESAGRKIIEVNPKNTSKMCSSCGNIKLSLMLTDREYHCDACGIAIDRDHNAAINIRRLGINLATVKPVSEANDFSRW